MRYLSVCSGIEAATLAWKPLGWKAAGFSEIDDFPRAVLQYHYPDIPLYGDFTEIQGNEPELGTVDLLVGGTPCQSFSTAGLRGGLQDARGNLALGFMQLAQRVNPRWIVWENVPGALSSNRGRDFGSILGALEELGYGWAYRTLDAQHFGVPQRRRRVFVVGCHAGWECAARVLFEPDCLQRNYRESRKKKEEDTRFASGGSQYSNRRLAVEREYVAADCYNHSVMLDGTTYTISTSTRHYTSMTIEIINGVKRLRRFTPIECERLQGFPDNFTAIPWKGKSKESCPDTPRYKVIGNSMAVPVMKWIGQRIQLVDSQIP